MELVTAKSEYQEGKFQNFHSRHRWNSSPMPWGKKIQERQPNQE